MSLKHHVDFWNLQTWHVLNQLRFFENTWSIIRNVSVFLQALRYRIKIKKCLWFTSVLLSLVFSASIACHIHKEVFFCLAEDPRHLIISHPWSTEVGKSRPFVDFSSPASHVCCLVYNLYNINPISLLIVCQHIMFEGMSRSIKSIEPASYFVLFDVHLTLEYTELAGNTSDNMVYSREWRCRQFVKWNNYALWLSWHFVPHVMSFWCYSWR